MSRRVPQGRFTAHTGIVLAIFAMASFSVGPLLVMQQKASPEALRTDSDRPFPRQAGIRGAYTNIGSKDIGPDVPKQPKQQGKDASS